VIVLDALDNLRRKEDGVQMPGCLLVDVAECLGPYQLECE
jgi:hypothetical protein